MSNVSYAVLTRAKSKFGKRLVEKDYKNLVGCINVSEVMTYLKTNTHYINAFGEANERDIHRNVFENLLRQYQNYQLDSICRYELSVGENFSNFIFHQTEITQIIRFLTLLNANDKSHFNYTFPPHLEKSTAINLHLLSSATTYQDFLLAIKGTKYDKILKEFNIPLNKHIPIAEIEDKLHIENYKELFSTIDNLQDVEAEELKDLFFAILDFENFLRIIRLKKYYHKDIDYIKSHLLPFGTLTDSKIAQIYNSSGVNEALSVMSKTKYGKMLRKIDYESTSEILKKIKFEIATHNMYFSNNPATVMMSYVILAEIELENLICIIEGIRYNIDKDKIKSLLIYWFRRCAYLSVENIKAFSIMGLEDKVDQAVDLLGNSGVFHPDDISNFFSDTFGFTHINASNIYSEPLSKITNTMNLLKIKQDYVSTKGYNLDFQQLENFADEIAETSEKLSKEKKDAKVQLNECKRAIEEAKHFVNIDLNINELLSMKYVKALFGRLPKDNLWKMSRYKDMLIEFVPCSEENKYVWGVFITPIYTLETAERIISRLHFEKSTLGEFNDTPSNKLKELEGNLGELEKRYVLCNEAIEKFRVENESDILKCYTKLSEYSLFNTIRTKAMVRNNTFCIVGWVPEKQVKELKNKLKKIESVTVTVANAKNELDLNPPVKLNNSFFTRPFQYYTEMYGVPKFKEIDPTSFIAITYVLLFGIMFGDIGHGLCVAIAGFLMWKFKKMPIGKILIPCGLSGAVFGVLFGSIFGFEHALDGFYQMLGFEEKPIHVMDADMTNTIIYVAVGIGMVLLCIAMILNIYSKFKQGYVGKALFDTSGLAGLIFYSLICAGIIGLLIFGTNLFTLPTILLIVVAFLLVFFREPLGELVDGNPNWMPKNIGGFIIENLFESIEVLLSYVTNTMSFLRVGAFVLVHAGMMEVVFTLAETIGGAGYIPVIIFGNILVCVLEALLVSIQVLRLEYYEMFSRFYSGEGRPYEPVKLKLTKN